MPVLPIPRSVIGFSALINRLEFSLCKNFMVHRLIAKFLQQVWNFLTFVRGSFELAVAGDFGPPHKSRLSGNRRIIHVALHPLERGSGVTAADIGIPGGVDGVTRGYQKGTSRKASQASPASPARMIRLMPRMMYRA